LLYTAALDSANAIERSPVIEVTLSAVGITEVPTACPNAGTLNANAASNASLRHGA
jgi:hypothetical protein